MPDITQDSSNLLSKRDQKRLELLKSLEEYSKEISQVNATVQNMTKPDLPLLPLPKLNELRARMAETSLERSSLPDEKNIRSYEDFYSIMYGTQEGVNMLRKQFGPTGLERARAKYGVQRGMNDLKSANAHYLKVRNTGKCKDPKAQVIRVKDYYPDPSREYIPRCTILHRCGDFTGCCDSDAFHCVPSAIQEVTLSFYALTIGKNGISTSNDVEKLLFQNHTACQCQPINDLPRLQDGLNNLQDGEEDPPSKSKCRECPVPFTSRVYKDGRCGCDCFDRQKPCLRIKRGREPLSEIERRCVLANQCHIPDCEYGLFNPESGYCPRRHDEDQRIHRRPNQLHHNHRRIHLERD
ncbi:Vascular endothelial growth factor A like protein [Argiope bruennichi]|uniref:Vascular endothelial growth factor A like protein n=2 Tax=Argiope bruennichi TaxID=94029 RepID=A0A8T0ET35_ARGBR|nr:Vascular endothelial growth factor A like protein [Argiope bruennichi]